MDLLSKRHYCDTYIQLPQALGLPEDSQLVSVGFDYARLGFFFVIISSSFDPVPLGALAPEIKVEWRIVKLSNYHR